MWGSLHSPCPPSGRRMHLCTYLLQHVLCANMKQSACLYCHHHWMHLQLRDTHGNPHEKDVSRTGSQHQGLNKLPCAGPLTCRAHTWIHTWQLGIPEVSSSTSTSLVPQSLLLLPEHSPSQAFSCPLCHCWTGQKIPAFPQCQWPTTLTHSIGALGHLMIFSHDTRGLYWVSCHLQSS